MERVILMVVGTLRELKLMENRVGLTPENVKTYTNSGHKVLVETQAGLGSGFSDEEYVNAGAKIVSAKEVWENAEMVVKVKEPLEEEYDLMREGQILYAYLHLAATRALTDALIKRKVAGVAYETLEDEHGGLPLLKPMSEIAGRLSVQEGAKCLEKHEGGRGVLLGGVPGVPRAKVVIIGGGVVGTNACKAAVGLGAEVSILDKSLDRLTYLDDIFGSRIQTLYSTYSTIEKELCSADLVIGAVLIPGGAAPKVVKREHLKNMINGSVIVDVAVDQGGCAETSHVTYHDNPTFVVDGVVHYCVGNMPGAVPRTSTIALTNATLSYGLCIADNGLAKACEINKRIITAINTYDGHLTHKRVGEAFDIKTKLVTDIL